MAAALRLAARSICRRALQGPQQAKYFSTAIREGGGSLRRFIASESTSLHNMPPPMGGLAKQVDVKKLELHKLLRLREGLAAAESSSMGAADNKELIQLIRGSNKDFVPNLHKSMAKTAAAIVATVYVEAKLIKAWHRRKYQNSGADVSFGHVVNSA